MTNWSPFPADKIAQHREERNALASLFTKSCTGNLLWAMTFPDAKHDPRYPDNIRGGSGSAVHKPTVTSVSPRRDHLLPNITSQNPLKMSNGTPYFLPAEKAQGLANYPHARFAPTTAHRTLYISGTSSRRGDGTWDGVTEHADGRWMLDIGAQTAAVLRNIESIIQGATDGRGGLQNIVDATVFLIDLPHDYSGMNEEWNKIWPDRANAPARTTIGVKELPNPRLLVEIKCTAVVEL